MLRRLLADAYGGTVVLETHWRGEGLTAEESTRRSFADLRAALAEAAHSRYRADMTPEERVRALDAIAEMNRGVPPLPSEAFDRENLYAEDEERE